MDLKTFISPLATEQRDDLAQKCGTTKGHLQNVMYGMKPCGAALAVLVERYTGGIVTRPELRPKDWQAIWPELAATTSAPTAQEV